MDFLSITVTLFLIMDPFGNIPIFLSVLDKVDPAKRRKILVRELLFALIIIVVCIFGGRYIIAFLGLKQESISIAGSIILFLIAIRMIFPYRIFDVKDEFDSEPMLFPLATPLVAGPSLLAVLLLFSSSQSSRMAELILAAAVAWAATFIILFSSTLLFNILKGKGLVAVERLMGMILVAVAVQLFLEGITGFMQGK